jgi:poly(3-hydroxybutyrate) depolymerase
MRTFQGLCRLAAASIPLLLLASPATVWNVSRVDDERIAKLASALAAHAQAHEAGRGLEKARGELERLTQEQPGWHPLRQSQDLGRAWQLARGSANERPGRIETEVVEPGSFGGAGLALTYRLPKGYAPTKTRYPLILTIPDFDQEPAEHLRAQWTLPAILDAAILVSPAMPSKREDWARVAVNGRPGGLAHVLTAARVASERFAVDFDRIYVVGRGKGVPAALAAGNTTPQRFAGVAGRAGDAGDVGPENFVALPILLLGAGAKGSELERKAKAAGVDTIQLQAAGGEQELWRWMLDNPRRSTPETVTVVPGDPFPTRVAWLQIAPSASDARATARIERATNTIHLTSNGIYKATLLLHDGLVNLDRPVRFVCNGIEQTGALQRSLTTALELLHDGTSDPACVYVARADLDLTATDPTALLARSAPEDAELAQQLSHAGRDAERLWAVYQWCRTNGRDAAAPSVLRSVLRSAPDHAAAREALGHVRGKDAWFPSKEALERYQRSQDPEVAKARNYSLIKGEWMHPEEGAFLTKGWTKDQESGLWISLEDRRRLDAGWVRQDLEWIAPAEAQKVDLCLWKVQGEWLDAKTTDRRRARIDDMWVIPGPQVVLHTTVDREVALRAQREMERACDDMRRVFGAEPRMPIHVTLLRDEEQYDRFAFGDPDGRRRGTHAARLHAVHTAFFAESWLARIDGELAFRGMGVGYWDPEIPNGHLYGVHSARLAAGLSYVDALDPSPKAVRRALAKDKGGTGGDYVAAYEAEKRLPAWLRYGGAVYVERYFKDSYAAADRDPWWPRAWSLDNLKARGGLRPLEEVFAFKLDPDKRDDGLKLLIEAGLLVSFAVDGECAPVSASLAELQRALAMGRLRPSLTTALVDSITANEAKLRTFAGL